LALPIAGGAGGVENRGAELAAEVQDFVVGFTS